MLGSNIFWWRESWLEDPWADIDQLHSSSKRVVEDDRLCETLQNLLDLKCVYSQILKRATWKKAL